MLGEVGDPAHDEYGLVNQEVSGGYQSTVGNGHGALDDLNTYRFSLCEFCLDHLFQQFVIPVKVGEFCLSQMVKGNGDRFVPQSTFNENVPFRRAAQRLEEDEWRRDKHSFYREHARRNQARRRP